VRPLPGQAGGAAAEPRLRFDRVRQASTAFLGDQRSHAVGADCPSEKGRNRTEAVARRPEMAAPAGALSNAQRGDRSLLQTRTTSHVELHRAGDLTSASCWRTPRAAAMRPDSRRRRSRHAIAALLAAARAAKEAPDTLVSTAHARAKYRLWGSMVGPRSAVRDVGAIDMVSVWGNDGAARGNRDGGRSCRRLRPRELAWLMSKLCTTGLRVICGGL
jgi:hypothetical protein